jgi:phenylacetate-CoA ligase
MMKSLSPLVEPGTTDVEPAATDLEPSHAYGHAHARPPAQGARAYARIYGSVLWPAWDRLVRGRTTAQRLAFVDAMQWRSPEAIERYQVQALRGLLIYAGRNVPYYRELFKRIGFDGRDVRTRADLSELPILTREIVRERYRDLVDPAHARENLKKGTSGSTGTPLKFEYSAESECWRQAIRIRGYSWSGYRPGLPTFYYWAQVSELPTGTSGMKIRFDRAIKRETFFDSMRQDPASRMRALEMLRRAKPNVLVCYVQSCAQFARWILENGYRDWDDIPVLCGAEAVLAADRAALERAFGPVFETYGSRETMLLAAECEAHDGMHLSEENLLVEVTRAGLQVRPGDSGEVLVTDLHNYGMPFIRYQNGDMATMASAAMCRCGRGLRRLQRVDGRRADTLIDRAGNPVPGIVFHVLFSDSRQEVIRQFQAVQKVGGDVVLRVVRGQDWCPVRFESVTKRFGSYLGGLPFQVEFRDAIAPGSNGKMKTIVVER